MHTHTHTSKQTHMSKTRFDSTSHQPVVARGVHSLDPDIAEAHVTDVANALCTSRDITRHHDAHVGASLSSTDRAQHLSFSTRTVLYTYRTQHLPFSTRTVFSTYLPCPAPTVLYICRAQHLPTVPSTYRSLYLPCPAPTYRALLEANASTAAMYTNVIEGHVPDGCAVGGKDNSVVQ